MLKKMGLCRIQQQKKNFISSAFWTGPSLRAGERCPDQGESQLSWARRAASG